MILSCEAEQPIWTTDWKLKIQKGFISVMQIRTGGSSNSLNSVSVLSNALNDCRKIQF